jgi:nitrate/nitrite transporter NarK
VANRTTDQGTKGRVPRIALIAVLATMAGGALFDDPGDSWLTVAPFVLVVLGTSALSAQLTAHGQRPAPRWDSSDTGVTAVLLGLSALLTLGVLADVPSMNGHTTAVCFAVLHLLFAGYFGFVRRKALRRAYP